MKNYTVDREKICVYDGYNIEQCSKCQSINSCKYLRSQLPLFEFLKIDDVTEVFDTKGIPQISISKKKSIYREKVVDHSWDYLGANTKEYTHRLHNYPAMMIPQVAGRLIETYRKKDSVLLDPFCGSGTVLVEAKLFGLNSYGIDINPLARLLSEVKTTLIEPYLLVRIKDKMLNNLKNIPDVIEYKTPNFHNIDFWFKERVVIQLAKIKKAILKIKNQDIQNYFMASFSETVRLSSNTKNGEFKLFRIEKDKLENYNPDVLGIFKKKTEANIRGMADFYKDADKKAWTKIIYGDSSKNNNVKDGSIDFLITSPPYGDSRTTVAYGQFSRLSAQWIDIFEDPNKASGVDNELLGGKATKTLEHSLNSTYLKNSLGKIAKIDEKRAKDVLSFYIGLNDCLKQAHRILKPKKYFCLVIGNRLVKQVRIPTDFIIAELGEKIGFTCEDIFVRNIPGKRMPIKNSPTNVIGATEETMNKESIVILRKN